jgi:hypothetical protein
MAKPRPEKKREERRPPPAVAAEHRVLPMQLKVGDQIIDERGEWRVIAGPYTTLWGKSVRVDVELIQQPTIMGVKSWDAHERVTVKRA